MALLAGTFSMQTGNDNRDCMRAALDSAVILIFAAIWSLTPISNLIADDAGPLVSKSLRIPVSTKAQRLNPLSEQEMEKYTESIPGTNVVFEMIPIRSGEFLMGSASTEKESRHDETPRHRVQIAPFWMGTHEVTWNEFDLWTYSIDIALRNGPQPKKSHRDKLADAVTRPSKPYTDMSLGMGREGYPAICMTHRAATTYCKWLSIKTGRYYRLPTEAEWEYACRAGTTTVYSFGNDAAKLGEYAWYGKNSADKYHKVGLKKPNAWGLFDMHGNVSEWCLDHYFADAYQKSPADNPHFPSISTYHQVVRGGNYLSEEPEALRCAQRDYSTEKWQATDPDVQKSMWYHSDAPFVGFRIVRPFITRQRP